MRNKNALSPRDVINDGEFFTSCENGSGWVQEISASAHNLLNEISRAHGGLEPGVESRNGSVFKPSNVFTRVTAPGVIAQVAAVLKGIPKNG